MDEIIKRYEKNSADNSVWFDALHVIEHMTIHYMTDITLALRCVESETKMPPKLFDRVHRAELACRALAGRISAVAEIFGSDNAVGGLRMASYDIEQFFTVLVNQMNTALGHKTKGDITFTMYKDTSGSVTFDARRVCMIMYHLVSNAIQHGNTEDKSISVRCRINKEMFEIAVQDHGAGVPKELEATLFSRFMEEFSLKNQLIGAFPPYISGLGLPLCKKLAVDMGGDIKFKNYVTGARFTVMIPQKKNCVCEVSVFEPDDVLMERCMADLLLQLFDEYAEKTEE